MTPISATGVDRPQTRAQPASDTAASDSALSRAGFTLVELLMVIAILGLAAGAVVLAVPDPRSPVGAETDRFAARLSLARDEAILSNRPVAVEMTSAGYAFSVFDGAGWIALTEGPFGPEGWEAGTVIDLADEGGRVVFDPTGVAEPASLILTRDGKRRTVSVDGGGEVRVDD